MLFLLKEANSILRQMWQFQAQNDVIWQLTNTIATIWRQCQLGVWAGADIATFSVSTLVRTSAIFYVALIDICRVGQHSINCVGFLQFSYRCVASCFTEMHWEYSSLLRYDRVIQDKSVECFEV